MNIFKPKPKAAPPTLKQRVSEFWKWFAANAERFYATIEDERCGELESETSEAVDKWLGGMAWVYGPGENKVGHSLTLTGEGILAKQFITEYWLQQAPKLPGWTFYASRQREEDVRDFILELDAKEKFRPIEFWVTPDVNEEQERVDLTVWHPLLNRLPEEPCYTALYLVLDEMLGEFGVQNWVGEIKFSDDRLKKSMPILELKEVISDLEERKAWKKLPPTQCYCTYRYNVGQAWLRGDTFIGGTRFYRLVSDYLENEGPCEHPTPDFGIDYVFVAMPADFFPKGNEVAVRGEIEDAVTETLEIESSGVGFGGALGAQSAYIDFMIYDGDRSLEIIKNVLRKLKVPKKTKIHFFTSDHANEVISI